MTEPDRSRSTPDQAQGPAPRPLPLALLIWLWPSLLGAFAVPGFMIVQIGVATGGEVVLSPGRLQALQQIGFLVLIGTVAMRVALWPSPRLQAFLKRWE